MLAHSRKCGCIVDTSRVDILYSVASDTGCTGQTGFMVTSREMVIRSRIVIPSRTPFILLIRVCLVCSLFSLSSSAFTCTLALSCSSC